MPDDRSFFSTTPRETAQALAYRRWGGRRILRLDELEPATRELVLRLVDADRAAKAKAASEAGEK